MLKYGLSLYLGQHKLNFTDTYEQERAIEKLIIHPGFSPSRVYDYDVALVKLQSPVKYNTRVQPVCLPKVILLESWGTFLTCPRWEI